MNETSQPPRTDPRRALRRVVTTVAAALFLVASGATAARADIGVDRNRWCGNSTYINEIQVQEWADGQFKIMIEPTYDSRFAGGRDVVVDMWHAVQRCVPGLHGTLADSIWDQLKCHQDLAIVKADPSRIGNLDGYATGDTYDLESWHDPFLPRNAWEIALTGNDELKLYIATHCGNLLNPERHPAGDPGQPFFPDGREAGYLDVQTSDNVG